MKTNILQIIENKLRSNINVKSIDVIDESEQHAKHQHHHKNGISHIRIIVVSHDFAKRSRIDNHRMIHNILREEIATLHSFSAELIDDLCS